MKWTSLVSSTALVASVGWCETGFAPKNLDLDKGTYAAVDLPVENFTGLLTKAEEIAGQKLQTRGEAHMTVLTPPEYMKLDGKVRKELLADIKVAVANGTIKPVCIGKGQAEVKGKMESTYFVVVEAKAVQAAREKYKLQDFYPHVTLGFTKRDLHFEDGVRKDKTSCVADLQPAVN